MKKLKEKRDMLVNLSFLDTVPDDYRRLLIELNNDLFKIELTKNIIKAHARDCCHPELITELEDRLSDL